MKKVPQGKTLVSAATSISPWSPPGHRHNQIIDSETGTLWAAENFWRNVYTGRRPMNPSEELRRHAMECGQMANVLRTKENKAAWNDIAERYLRFAQWYDTRRSTVDRLKDVRRQNGSRLRLNEQES